jgi:hypothetical protein
MTTGEHTLAGAAAGCDPARPHLVHNFDQLHNLHTVTVQWRLTGLSEDFRRIAAERRRRR